MKSGMNRASHRRHAMPTLYGWGSNLHGQLGRSLDELVVPCPVPIHRATDIVATNASQLLYRNSGSTYLLGYSSEHHLEKSQPIPVQPLGQPVGQDSILAYINNGTVCYGKDFCLQGSSMVWKEAAADLRGRIAAITGKSRSKPDKGVPWLFTSVGHWAQCSGSQDDNGQILLEADTYAMVLCRHVTAGGAHFVFLTSNSRHRVYATGDNRFGQLGDVALPLETHSLCPVEFFSETEAFPSDVDHVACGNRHTLIKTVDGDCYSWGLAPDGSIQPPDLVELESDIVAVACGASSSYFLDEQGTIYAMGDSKLPKTLTQTNTASWAFLPKDLLWSPSKSGLERPNPCSSPQHNGQRTQSSKSREYFFAKYGTYTTPVPHGAKSRARRTKTTT